MKLVYLSESKIPSREANSIHVMKMCEAFAQLGHHVVLVVPDTVAGIEPGVTDPYGFYGVKADFAIKRMPWRKVKGRGWIYGWTAGRFAGRLDIDLAYGRNLRACAVAVGAGIPTVWDSHELSFFRNPLDRALFRRMSRTPAFVRLVVNCDALRRALIAEMPELNDRMLVAHNGADVLGDDVEPAGLGKIDNRLQVGYVGQSDSGKGFEVVRPLASCAPWADFHVVGGRDDTVAAFSNNPDRPKNLHLHGFVPPVESTRFRLACDVLLAPYQSEVRTAGGSDTAPWMSPIKLFEYMAAGKPIVCSDLPVLREIVEDERTALLVPPDDMTAWVLALRRLADDVSLRQRLGAAARQEFLDKHTWRKRAEAVLSGLP